MDDPDTSRGDDEALATAPSHPTRLVYFGTPAMSVPPLHALVEAGFDVALVVSNPDRRRGRGGRTHPSPVKAAALDLGVPVTDRIDDCLDVGADLGVVVAFGQLIKPHVLRVLPMVNLHFSLLPRWRGAAPVERAILAGDERTGVDLMDVAAGLDTGDVRARVEVDIGPDETAEVLRHRLVAAGTELLVDTLRAGLPPGVPQSGASSYAAKLAPEDLHIDWSTPAEVIHRQVRVGGAWTTRQGDRIKVWETTLEPGEDDIVHPTGTAPIGLRVVQPAGKGRLPAAAWANGARLGPDERLGA